MGNPIQKLGMGSLLGKIGQTKPLQNMVKPLQNLAKPLQNVGLNKPLQNLAKPLQNVGLNKPLQNMAKPLQNVGLNKPLQNMVKPLQNVAKPLQNVVNPVQNVAMGKDNEPIETSTDKKGLFKVSLTDICKFIVNCGIAIVYSIYWVISRIYRRFKIVFNFLMKLIIQFIVFLSLPIIVFFVVYWVISGAWDGGVKPLMEIIQTGINGVVNIWNQVVRALRSFGVKIPTASGFGQEIPTMWGFVKMILYGFLKVFEETCRGFIFR